MIALRRMVRRVVGEACDIALVKGSILLRGFQGFSGTNRTQKRCVFVLSF